MRAEVDPSIPLIPAKAGTQIGGLRQCKYIPNNIEGVEPYDLGPGLRRDERNE
jgi:hypothetical protein